MRATWPRVFGEAWSGLILAAAIVMGGASARGAIVQAVAPTAGAVGLVGVRFGGGDSVTRVVLDLDGAVTGKLLVDDRTMGRLVIALPPVLASGPMRGRGKGLVAGWSVRDDARGAQLVLEVAPGVSAVHRFLIPPSVDGGPWRYVIDLAPGESREDPLAALVASSPGSIHATPNPDKPRSTNVSAANPAPRLVKSTSGATPSQLFASSTASRDLVDSPPPPPPPTPTHAVLTTRVAVQRGAPGRALKVIVIDAGHGGHDSGARSLVRNEKDITLAAALQLKTRLLAMGRYKVVLTRDSDVFIPLESRVQIARHAGADLFISLHADSAGSDPTPHGASVYTLSDHGETRVNTVLGPHEWFAHTGDKRTDPGVRQILLDLTQTSTRNRSSQFAGTLIEHIGDKVDLLPRSHRDAGYFVLLAPDVPAVLLEMGFITNPADEMRLTDPAQREALMDGVADAIDAYFSGAPHLAAG
jgi:N-acetylmuramoyl-L-alanine amidase